MKLERRYWVNARKYMKYPEYTLTKLGKSMMSIDFIGPRLRQQN